MVHDMLSYELPAVQDRADSFEWMAGDVPKPVQNNKALAARNRAIRFVRDRLTKTQSCFVMYYLENCDLLQAAYNSGLVYRGTSVDATMRQATRLFNQPFIKQAISLILDYRIEAKRFVYDRDKYLHIIDRAAEANLADYVDEEGQVRLPDRSNREAWAGIHKFTEDEYENGKRSGVKRKIEVHEGPKWAKTMLDFFESGKASPSGTKEFGQIEQGAPQPIIFNIVPVPSNEFVPAPDVAHTTIEHAA